MAKKRSAQHASPVRQAELPTIEKARPEPTPPAPPPVQQPADVTKESVGVDLLKITVTVPVLVGLNPAGYRSNRIEAKSLSRAQSMAAKGILDGLKHKDVTLSNGKQVRDRSDIIVFMLDEIAKQLPASENPFGG